MPIPKESIREAIFQMLRDFKIRAGEVLLEANYEKRVREHTIDAEFDEVEQELASDGLIERIYDGQNGWRLTEAGEAAVYG